MVVRRRSPKSGSSFFFLMGAIWEERSMLAPANPHYLIRFSCTLSLGKLKFCAVVQDDDCENDQAGAGRLYTARSRSGHDHCGTWGCDAAANFFLRSSPRR